MREKLDSAFSSIKASEALKGSTLAYVTQQAQAPRVTRKPRLARRLVLVAACLLFVLLAGGVSYSLYFTPTAFVDVDVNPSIELTLNRFGRVLRANAYNDEGEVLLSALQLRHQSYETALDGLLAAMWQEGYLQEDGLLSVTVQASQGEDALLAAVQADIDVALAAYSLRMRQEIYTVDAGTKTHSHAAGVSPARYLAITALQEVDPEATLEECRGHSLSELREYTQGHGHQNGNAHGGGGDAGIGGITEEAGQDGSTGHHGKGGTGAGRGHGSQG